MPRWRSPTPLSVEEVQAQLRADEALVLFLDTPERQADAGGDLHLGRDQDGRALGALRSRHARRSTREVAALRCGLDATRVGRRRARKLRRAACKHRSRTSAEARCTPLPFDPARAHALYKALFGQVEDLIKGKHLLIVPSGPLTQLPFQVLVTAAASEQATTSPLAWLAREHAITVLPAVSSLKALRRVAKPSAATKPMIGFGNPLLDGDQSHPQYGDYYKQQAALARRPALPADARRKRTVASLVGRARRRAG